MHPSQETQETSGCASNRSGVALSVSGPLYLDVSRVSAGVHGGLERFSSRLAPSPVEPRSKAAAVSALRCPVWAVR